MKNYNTNLAEIKVSLDKTGPGFLPCQMVSCKYALTYWN